MPRRVCIYMYVTLLSSEFSQDDTEVTKMSPFLYIQMFKTIVIEKKKKIYIYIYIYPLFAIGV